LVSLDLHLLQLELQLNGFPLFLPNKCIQLGDLSFQHLLIGLELTHPGHIQLHLSVELSILQSQRMAELLQFLLEFLTLLESSQQLFVFGASDEREHVVVVERHRFRTAQEGSKQQSTVGVCVVEGKESVAAYRLHLVMEGYR
jgi:hypothetical protein